jgi:hypothetical protein
MSVTFSFAPFHSPTQKIVQLFLHKLISSIITLIDNTRDLIVALYQHNKCIISPHMRVDSTH